MAVPTFSAHAPSQSRAQAAQIQRREQENWRRQQWDEHARYFREEDTRCQRQMMWSSSDSYQQSMSAYHRQRVKDEKEANLQQRKNRLRAMLQDEQDYLEKELRELVPNRSTLASQLVQKTDELCAAREQRRKKLAQELLRERWKKTNQELREVESALQKDHVVAQWQEQISEKKQQFVEEQEEEKRFENEFERARTEALERMREAEEKKKEVEQKRLEELCKQMEELKQREEEATHLKKEEDALLMKQWELEKIEEERKEVEERRKKSEMRQFLIRQYRAQLKQRAQQIQEELEADRNILAALLEGQVENKRMETVRRERAVADTAWMKCVIEEQLQFEREREAEFDILCREEAQHVWEKREAQWEMERKARKRLMQEVLLGRKQQLEMNMQKNREAQEESLRRREDLIRELEREKELRHKEREQEENLKTARMQEINSQVEQKHKEQREELLRIEQEEREQREALRNQEDEQRLEMQRMVQKGYQEKIYSRPRSAWT